MKKIVFFVVLMFFLNFSNCFCENYTKENGYFLLPLKTNEIVNGDIKEFFKRINNSHKEVKYILEVFNKDIGAFQYVFSDYAGTFKYKKLGYNWQFYPSSIENGLDWGYPFYLNYRDGAYGFVACAGRFFCKKEKDFSIYRKFELIDDEVVLTSNENFESSDGEIIKFKLPQNGNVVSSSQKVSILIANLNLNFKFIEFNPDLRQKFWNSNYNYEFFVNDQKVSLNSGNLTILENSPEPIFYVKTNLTFSPEDEGKEFKLVAKLLKDEKIIAQDTIRVIYTSTFVDVDGDGVDDRTGATIGPNNMFGLTGIFGSFFKIFNGLFSSIINLFSTLFLMLESVITSSTKFINLILSVFKVDKTLHSLMVLSVGIVIALRILKR